MAAVMHMTTSWTSAHQKTRPGCSGQHPCRGAHASSCKSRGDRQGCPLAQSNGHGAHAVLAVTIHIVHVHENLAVQDPTEQHRAKPGHSERRGALRSTCSLSNLA